MSLSKMGGDFVEFAFHQIQILYFVRLSNFYP
jgi:hypothetical protein